MMSEKYGEVFSTEVILLIEKMVDEADGDEYLAMLRMAEMVLSMGDLINELEIPKPENS